MSKKLTQLPAAALSELDDTEIIAATVTPGATPVSKTITTRRLRQRLIGAQGYKRGSPPLAGWQRALYLAEAGTDTAKIVRIGDSHGEVGVDMPFQTIFNNYLSKRTSFGWSGYWMAATTSLTHSGAVSSSAGPVGYGVALDSGDYVQFGDGLFVQNTGWQVYGTGLVTIEVRNGGTPVETWTGTLAANVPWQSTVVNFISSYTCRVTAGAGGATVWGAFGEVENRTSGYQQWGFNHSGWKSSDAIASSSTWTMLDAIDPDLVILAMATNEASAASYLAGTETMIGLARAANPDRSVALWFPHMASASGDDEDWWAAAHENFLDLCYDYNCLPLDYYALFGDLSTADPFDLCSGDNVHLSAQGNQVYSRIQAEALLPLSQPNRFIDATGTKPADTVRLRNSIDPTKQDVVLFSGQSGGGTTEMLSIVRADLSAWVPIGVGTATNAVHAVNLTTGDTRYTGSKFVPAKDFFAVTGTPVLAAYGTDLGVAMAFDAAAVEKAVATIDVPSAWLTFRIDAVWTNLAGGAGNVVWATEVRFHGDTDDFDAVAADTETMAAVAAPAQDVTKVTVVGTTVTRTASKFVTVHIERTGTSGSDTLANDAGLIGLNLVRLT